MMPYHTLAKVMTPVSQDALKVGCCGFPTRQLDYYRIFPTVELQSTFYNLPQSSTALRWRSEAPAGFEFCLKAWQAITHPATSPTWRRVSMLNRPANKSKCGHLRPTRENFDAWDKTLEVCKILKASVCLIQCPPSLRFSRRNTKNVRQFLGHIDRGSTTLAWEPRGDWKEHPQEIRKLCHELDLIHAVDILRSEPARETQTRYFRLHGLGPGEYNYRYRYSRQDLRNLQKATAKAFNAGAKRVLVLFNNLSMLENARAFNTIIHEVGGRESLAE